jgi:hypothetical protein
MAGVYSSVPKQGSVTRVRVNNEPRIGQMGAERERIDSRNQNVVFCHVVSTLARKVAISHRASPDGPDAAR